MEKGEEVHTFKYLVQSCALNPKAWKVRRKKELYKREKEKIGWISSDYNVTKDGKHGGNIKDCHKTIVL